MSCRGSAKFPQYMLLDPMEKPMKFVNSHGATIPSLGFGVFRMSDAEVESVVPAALEAGFRHFDTAQIYQNEAALGRALQKAGARREDIF